MKGFLYYDLCAWENATLTHKLIDGETLTSPFIDPLAWNPMQSDEGRDVGDGKLMYGGKVRRNGPPSAPVLSHLRQKAPAVI